MENIGVVDADAKMACRCRNVHRKERWCGNGNRYLAVECGVLSSLGGSEQRR